MAKARLEKSIQILIDVCLNVQSGEDIAIVTDTNKEAIARMLNSAVLNRGAETTLLVMSPRSRHGEEPTKAAARAMLGAAAVILPTTYSLTHTKARRAAREAGTRALSLPACTEQIFTDGSLQVDFLELSKFVEEMGRQLSTAKKVRLMSGEGAVLSMTLAGRKSVDQTGLCRKPGALAVPPDVETAVSPLEGTTSGTLVVDGVIVPGGQVAKPVTLVFEGGRITEIQGGEDATKLNRLLKDYDDPNMFCPVELGIGMNPKARMGRGAILEDEGEFGAVHIGLGEGRTFGSSISGKAHIDIVMKSPTLELDGKVILRNKEFKLNRQTLKVKDGNLECV